MSDLDRFLGLLQELRDALHVLDRYRRSIDRDRLVAEIDLQNMVLFALYRAVQGCIDLGQHLIAERGLTVPTAYRQVFRVLAEAALIDPDLGQRLERWGGFRNVIAHQYGTLDVERVATALYDNLGDLDLFATEMGRIGAVESGS